VAITNPKWEDDNIQFPRLLAEIRAVGLTQFQYDLLHESMDLARDDIDAILERAESKWQAIKEASRKESQPPDLFVWHYRSEPNRFGTVFAKTHAEAARKALATLTERHSEYIGTPDPHIYSKRAGYTFKHPSSATAPEFYVFVHTHWSRHIPEANNANPS
jgi:hypothetical protein